VDTTLSARACNASRAQDLKRLEAECLLAFARARESNELRPKTPVIPEPPVTEPPVTEVALSSRLRALQWRGGPRYLATATDNAAHEVSSSPGLRPRVTSSGLPTLDAELPDGGWPAGLIEILQDEPAGLEWALLAPVWTPSRLAPNATKASANSTILCVDPPHEPYMPLLQAQGIRAHQLLRVTCSLAADAAWAAEQGARSASCAAVIWWVSANLDRGLSNTILRRLHLAAQAGQTPVFALRHQAVRSQASPALLRAMLNKTSAATFAVTLFKRRGPPMEQALHLNVPWLPPGFEQKVGALTSVKNKLRRGPNAVVRLEPASVTA
jgi:protein ImuA